MRTGKIVDIVQARMGSSRLPGKVLMPLCGRPLIEHLLERLSYVRRVDEVWVATTTSAKDDPLAEFLMGKGINVYRGPEDDVLTRYVETARKSGADIVLRHTADCPLVDPELVDIVIEVFLGSEWDCMQPAPEEGLIRGLDTEIFTREALLRTDRKAKDGPDREHVTLYMYRHPEEFIVGDFPPPQRWMSPGIRLCVDEEQDFKLIESIYEELYAAGKIIPFGDVLKLFESRPELKSINRGVCQKAP